MKEKVVGYLPDERPSFGRMLLFGLQHILVMLPATVLVAILTGFPIVTTLFASGFATMCFLLITKGKIPLYYGSSFAYLAPIMSLTAPNGDMSAWVNGIAPASLIGQALLAIMISGVFSIIAGILIKKFGKGKMDKILPATITGPIAMLIALLLAGAAINDSSGATSGVNPTIAWIVAIFTLVAIITFTIIFKKGVLSQIPLLLGIGAGYIFSIFFGLVDFSNIFNGNIFSLASLPEPLGSYLVFNIKEIDWNVTFSIALIAIATIPESTAHLFQLDLYVNKLAEEKESNKRYNISDRLGDNLIGDGCGDIASALVAGPAGTNYGENISTMAITKNFSVWVLGAAAVMTMIVSMFSPLSNLLYSIPKAVVGGASIYLFGVIAAQGIAIMIDKKVNMFDSKNLAIIAVVLILGLGTGNIALAAVSGIIMNLIFSIKWRRQIN